MQRACETACWTNLISLAWANGNSLEQMDSETNTNVLPCLQLFAHKTVLGCFLSTETNPGGNA